jgi:hypothetical protein
VNKLVVGALLATLITSASGGEFGAVAVYDSTGKRVGRVVDTQWRNNDGGLVPTVFLNHFDRQYLAAVTPSGISSPGITSVAVYFESYNCRGPGYIPVSQESMIRIARIFYDAQEDRVEARRTWFAENGEPSRQIAYHSQRWTSGDGGYCYKAVNGGVVEALPARRVRLAERFTRPFSIGPDTLH